MSTEEKQILIVDDDADQLFITRELLEAKGYSVLTHQSPFGVAELIHASGPDLVMLDFDMPAMPGDALAGYLRADSRISHVPIVLYSAAEESRLMHAVMKHRLDGYIMKGDPVELIEKVAALLDKSASDRAMPVGA